VLLTVRKSPGIAGLAKHFLWICNVLESPDQTKASQKIRQCKCFQARLAEVAIVLTSLQALCCHIIDFYDANGFDSLLEGYKSGNNLRINM
jgi:hypothetical protein